MTTWTLIPPCNFRQKQFSRLKLLLLSQSPTQCSLTHKATYLELHSTPKEQVCCTWSRSALHPQQPPNTTVSFCHCILAVKHHPKPLFLSPALVTHLPCTHMQVTGGDVCLAAALLPTLQHHLPPCSAVPSVTQLWLCADYSRIYLFSSRLRGWKQALLCPPAP